MRAGGRTRGQSEILGTVLLLGIVVLASLAVAGLAMGAFGGTQDQAEDRAIEQMLLDIRSSGTDVALQGVDHRSVAVEPPGDATLDLDEDAGQFKIVHRNYDGSASGSEEVLFNESIGRLAVDHDDRQYAFEGGGVFRMDDGHTRLIASPPIGYRGLTANVALIRLDGEGTRSGPSTIDLRPGTQVLPAYPNAGSTYDGSSLPYDNPVFNGTVDIVVTSEYYEGWYDFFTQRTSVSSVTKYDSNETVVASLASLTELQPERAITYTNSFENSKNKNSGVDEDQVEHTEYLPDSEPIIEKQLDEAADSNDNDEVDCLDETSIDDGCVIDDGTYYFSDDVAIGGDIEFDTSDGNVTIAVDGDFDIANNEILVSPDSSENGVTYYILDDFDAQGNGAIRTTDVEHQSYRNVLVVGGGALGDSPGDGTPRLDVIMYAPNAEIVTHGNSEINGAIYSKSLSNEGNVNIYYDESAAKRAIDLTPSSTPVMFLHVTRNDVVATVS